VILCAFSPLLVPPTPASCDVLISGTNITTKNTSKAALDANKQIEKAKPLSAEIVDRCVKIFLRLMLIIN